MELFVFIIMFSLRMFSDGHDIVLDQGEKETIKRNCFQIVGKHFIFLVVIFPFNHSIEFIVL
jgi:hypothetical protein